MQISVIIIIKFIIIINGIIILIFRKVYNNNDDNNNMAGRDLVLDVINKLREKGIKEVSMAELVRTITANSNLTEVTVRYYIRELIYKGKVKVKGSKNKKILILQ